MEMEYAQMKKAESQSPVGFTDPADSVVYNTHSEYGKSVVYNTQKVCANELEKIAEGEFLPESLEEIASSLSALFLIAKLIVPVSSLLIAQARKKHFHNNTRAWTDWVKTNTGYEGAILHHRRAIGDLLIAVRDKDAKTFRKLIDLPEDKLITLTRIKPSEIPQFVATNDVKALSRAALRNAVSLWLGEPVQEDKQLILPGFSKILDEIDKIELDGLINAVTDMDVAQKVMIGGMSMLAAAVEFHKKGKNLAVLEALQNALRDEADKIAEAMKG